MNTYQRQAAIKNLLKTEWKWLKWLLFWYVVLKYRYLGYARILWIADYIIKYGGVGVPPGKMLEVGGDECVGMRFKIFKFGTGGLTIYCNDTDVFKHDSEGYDHCHLGLWLYDLEHVYNVVRQFHFCLYRGI